MKYKILELTMNLEWLWQKARCLPYAAILVNKMEKEVKVERLQQQQRLKTGPCPLGT